jgi:hypothetical protein
MWSDANPLTFLGCTYQRYDFNKYIDTFGYKNPERERADKYAAAWSHAAPRARTPACLPLKINTGGQVDG